MNLSVVIITLNEEKNLGRCIASLPSNVEICVLDSGSSDGTEQICRDQNAAFSFRKFDNYANQKNAAIQLARRDWVLSLDADETLEESCHQALAAITEASDSKHSAYRITRRLVFQGNKMRFGKTVDRPIRLFRNGRAHFKSAIHEKLTVEGSIGVCPGQMLHYSYADLTDYFFRFNRYTSRIAENHFNNEKRLPAKPVRALRFWSEFLTRYLLRGGFLDGYPGYIYALISSMYAFTKYEKLAELVERDFSSQTSNPEGPESVLSGAENP